MRISSVGKALCVVQETHPFLVYLIYGTFVLETQYVGKEASHLAGAKD